VLLDKILQAGIKKFNRVMFGILSNGDLSSAWKVWKGIGEWHGVFLGLPLVAVGLGLGFSSGALTWWIVRPAPRGCPACGFGEVDDEGRCTECGYR